MKKMSDEEVELCTHTIANMFSLTGSKAVLTPTLWKPRRTMSKGFVFFNIFLLVFRETKGEGDRNIDQLPPGHETETWAYALTRNQTSDLLVHESTLNHSTTPAKQSKGFNMIPVLRKRYLTGEMAHLETGT